MYNNIAVCTPRMKVGGAVGLHIHGILFSTAGKDKYDYYWCLYGLLLRYAFSIFFPKHQKMYLLWSCTKYGDHRARHRVLVNVQHGIMDDPVGDTRGRLVTRLMSLKTTTWYIPRHGFPRTFLDKQRISLDQYSYILNAYF